MDKLSIVPVTVDYVRCVARGHRFQLLGLHPQKNEEVTTTDAGCNVGDRFTVPNGTTFRGRLDATTSLVGERTMPMMAEARVLKGDNIASKNLDDITFTLGFGNGRGGALELCYVPKSIKEFTLLSTAFVKKTNVPIRYDERTQRITILGT